MFTKSLLLTAISFVLAVQAEGNDFVHYYEAHPQFSRPVISAAPQRPAPVVAAPAVTTANIQSNNTANTSVNTIAQMEEAVEVQVPFPLPRPEHLGNSSADDSVSGDTAEVVQNAEIVAPIPMPHSMRPPTPTTPTVRLFDLTNCRYGNSCWSRLSLTEKIRKVVANVDTVNRLHGTQLDPRYMLCTGYRESRFNPGARGADGERGMFQIMTATGKGAVLYGPKVEQFKNYNTRSKGETYLSEMVNSTLAQTELSFLVLKMKVAENRSVSSRVLSGGATIAQYKALARAYNGAGAAAERYSNKISNCLSCMRERVPSIRASTVTENQVKTCLNRATD